MTAIVTLPLMVERDDRALRRARWLHAAPARPRWYFAVKRAADVLVAAALLVALAPLFALVALAIVVISPGPAFFAQQRVGRGGRTFRLYKFRTMVDGAHGMRTHVAHMNERDGPAFKIANDPRLHPLGALLRRTSIDELPQLWNVLRGDMSMVGPRPPLPEEVERYEPRYMQRLCMTPGLTGLWQVSGRANVPFRRWMAMDVLYVRRFTPWFDAWLLLRTVPAVISGDGAC